MEEIFTKAGLLVNTDPFLVFFGSFYMVIGLSMFFAKKPWEEFMELFAEKEAISLILGVLILPISLFIVVFYNDWTSLASIILMVTGYLGFVKAVILLLKPSIVQATVKRKFVQKWLWLDGISGILLGGAMLLL